VDARICGGWGVDALLGEQTRPHEDLDLWVRVEHDRALRDALGSLGFFQLRVDSPWNHVLADGNGRQVDVHLVHVHEDGTAVYEIEDDDPYVMAPEVFTTGEIGGRTVPCVTPAQQMRDHAGGYEPGETDHADMRRLHDRFGTPYLLPYGDP
jgi:lincosamide nucleotidyltransferase A/C/D/E